MQYTVECKFYVALQIIILILQVLNNIPTAYIYIYT